MPITSEGSSKRLTNIRKRAVGGILRAWKEVEDAARDVIGREFRPSLPKEDLEALKELMQDCLSPKGGDISARAHTAELGNVYRSLNAAGKARFLKLFAEEFDLDHTKIEPLIDRYGALKKPLEKSEWESELREALITPRSQILRQFTALPDGFKFLVDMRADLMPLIKNDGALRGLETELKAVLSSWFDVGLLDLVEISWEKSPAALLEKLIQYEAVHEIRSWQDLKNRLDKDRKIYAFFHSKMPLEPLIFVQVAFVKGLAGNIQELLDIDSPTESIAAADTAIFYSISNAQAGLSGISFGNFLIKRVVAELSGQYENIKNFATLSPVPAFRKWLDPLLVKGDESVLESAERKVIQQLVSQGNAASALEKILDTPWCKDAALTEALKPILMRLCAQYLLEEKRGNKPLDPVASFHLFNGARLERMNWLADTSDKGFKQSAGIMVNYYYKLSDIDDNHEDFVTNGKIVASRSVRGYL
jgi:malonyl-CoA decarboxylase